MERSPHFILFLGVLILIFASAKACVKSVFLFGDSQFDSGNNPYLKDCKIQANFPPYGSTFFKRPTGRFADGRTVADFIAQYLKIDFQKPYQEYANNKWPFKWFPRNGINFASGGSGILPHSNLGDGVTPVEVQLQQFQSLVDHKHVKKKQVEDSLFLLESGSVDVLNYFLLRNTSDPKAYVQGLLKEVNEFVDTIYKLGARKIVIFTIGPMGCVPLRIGVEGASPSECLHKVNTMALDYNAGLKLLVNKVPKKYEGATVVYGSIYSIVHKLLENPKVHGFDNTNDACCGGGPLNGVVQCGKQGFNMCSNRSSFFFWDYIHPSERAYELLSQELWSGKEDQTWPMNLETLACNTTL